MEQQFGITHFYFVESDRTCFLRVHQPQRRGDRIERVTMLTAQRTRRDAWGLELGPLGTFTLRYVRPWLDDSGEVAGFIELGMEVEDLLDDLAEDLNVDIVSLVRKGDTTRGAFEAGKQVFGFAGHWRQFQDVAIMHQTLPVLPKSLADRLQEGYGQAANMTFRVSDGDRELDCGEVCLRDASGRSVVDLILLHDVTSQVDAARQNLILGLGLGTAVLAGVLFLLWSISEMVESQLGSVFVALRERVKELTCLQKVREELQTDAPLENQCERIADHLVQGMQFPDIASVSIELKGKQITDDGGSHQSAPGLHANIESDGMRLGSLSVHYLSEKPFLSEEQDLVDAIASILGRHMEQRRAETQLRESEVRLRAITDSAQDAILMMDPDGQISYWSPAAVRILGYTSEESIGQNLHELLAPSRYHDAHHTAFPQFQRTGHGPAVGTTLELEALTRDGTEIPITLSLSAVKLDGGWHSVGIVRDETQRKQMQDQMRASHARYRSLFDNAISGVAIHEVILDEAGTPVDFTLLEVNPAFETQTGLRSVDVTGRLGTEIFPGIEEDSLISIYGQVALTGECTTLEYYSIALERYYQINCFQVGQGRFATVFRDISDSVTTEAALREAERFARMTIDALSAHIAIIDEMGEIVAVNLPWQEFAEANSSICVDDWEGVNYLAVCDSVEGPDSEAAERMAAGIRAVISGEQNEYIHEYPCHSPDQRRWFTARVTQFALGSDRRVVIAHEDITERKQAELALRHQTQLLSTILDGIPDIIALQAPDHTILQYNQAGYDFLGLTPEECHGRKCYELIGRDVTCDGCASTTALKAKRVASIEKHLPESDIWIDVRSIPVLDDQGNVIQIVEQLRDITRRKRVEEDLSAANEELEQHVGALQSANRALEEFNSITEAATRAKSEFLANMSHEIRTPMTAILGYCDLLAESLDCCTKCPDYRSCDTRVTNLQNLQVVRRNGEHLLSLINDILDLSKIEAGKLEVALARYSPVEVLTDVISLMRVRATKKGIGLTTEIVGPLPETVLVDSLRLRQILVNIVGNAIKFTERGGVHIRTQLVNEGDPPRLRFDVTDTGIGMTEEQVELVFQAFSQVDSSVSRKAGGTGLGLTISKRLAEAMGGCIQVQSTLGRGSTFSIFVDPGPLEGISMTEELPGQMVEPPSPAVPADKSEEDLHCRVLLVEDGLDNQRLIRHFLGKAGADVTVAENGELAVNEVLTAAKMEHPFDVILMDMQMPVMDGYTATQSLRERGYSGPIVALTAHAMAQDRQECIDAGCDDYLTKPIDRKRLLEVVAAWAAQAASAYDSKLSPSRR